MSDFNINDLDRGNQSTFIEKAELYVRNKSAASFDWSAEGEELDWHGEDDGRVVLGGDRVQRLEVTKLKWIMGWGLKWLIDWLVEWWIEWVEGWSD